MSPRSVDSMPPDLGGSTSEEPVQQVEQVLVPPDVEMGPRPPPGGEDGPGPVLEEGARTPDDN
eukprot:8178681-Pyramimonas_sp.AAC.1